MRLEGKVAVITGAGSGMGATMATTFAAEGAKVVIADLNLDNAALVADKIQHSGLNAIAVYCNVSLADDVCKLFATTKETFGAPDIIINNAGKPQVKCLTTYKV